MLHCRTGGHQSIVSSCIVPFLQAIQAFYHGNFWMCLLSSSRAGEDAGPAFYIKCMSKKVYSWSKVIFFPLIAQAEHSKWPTSFFIFNRHKIMCIYGAQYDVFMHIYTLGWLSQGNWPCHLMYSSIISVVRIFAMYFLSNSQVYNILLTRGTMLH
jgi:hypothetical protein